MKELATQTDVNHKANRRPAFEEVGLVAAVIKVINEDIGLGKEKGCRVLKNMSMVDRIEREMYQREGLVVSSGVEGSSTIAQES